MIFRKSRIGPFRGWCSMEARDGDETGERTFDESGLEKEPKTVGRSSRSLLAWLQGWLQVNKLIPSLTPCFTAGFQQGPSIVSKYIICSVRLFPLSSVPFTSNRHLSTSVFTNKDLKQIPLSFFPHNQDNRVLASSTATPQNPCQSRLS